MQKLGRFFWFFVLFCLLSFWITQNRITQAQGSSALANLAGSMQPGTWAKLQTNGLTPSMIFPGGEDGILPYSMNMVWDSARHIGYFFGGEHNGVLACASNTYNDLACADSSQRFLKYNETTNTWSLQLDSVTGKPHSGKAGAHSDDTLTINPATGDVYKYWYGFPGAFQRFSPATQSWTSMAAPTGFDGGYIPGFGWYPEANGIIIVSGGFGQVAFWNKNSDSWSSLFSGLTMGTYPGVGIYNPVQHNMLISGGCADPYSDGRERNFYILTYSSGNWSISPVRHTPIYSVSNSYQLCLDSDGLAGHVSVDPTSGKYVVITRDATANNAMFEYDSQSDTWTQMTGSHTPPSALRMGNPAVGGADKMASVAIPEYGVIMYLNENSDSAEVWLYKHGGTGGALDTVAPSAPSGLLATAVSSSQINLSWTAATDNMGVAGYKIYRNGSMIGTAGITSYSDLGRSSSTTYTYAVSAYDAAGNTSGLSPSASATTSSSIGSSPSTVSPGSGDTISPSIPTNLRVTAASANQIELMWTAATDNVGVVGYKIYRNNVLVGSSTYPVFLSTGLSPGTTYTFKVSAKDAAGNESSTSSNVSGTTDSALYTFAQKCASAGVLKCESFDDPNDLVYAWPTPLSAPGFGDGCDRALGAKYTNRYFDPTVSTPANVRATFANGQCVYASIDSSIKHSGGGSLRFPVPNHSTADTSGEFSEAFKKYPDGSFGYVGPTTSVPTASARHEGDVLWVQWYQRVDSAMLTTNFKTALYISFYWTTASAGATTVSTADCGIPAQAAGQKIWFAYGSNFLTNQSFTIASVAANGCSMTLTASPTPSGAGGSPIKAQGLISGGRSGLGWKQFGIFGNPPNTTCCGPATQIAVNGFQMGVPQTYSYDNSGTVTYEGTDGVQGARGCAFQYPGDYDNGVTYTEPPCIRYHANQWQEYTVRLEIRGASGQHTSHYQQWIDGQLTQDINDFALTWGTVGTANGLGQFVLNPYQTNKDPNQDHPDTAVWYDDVIISTQPIPMMSSTSGSSGSSNSTDNIPPTVSIIAPTAGSTLTGDSVLLSASASDNVAIAGVQFKLDGVNIGTESAVAPYSTTWNIASSSNGTHTITAIARDTSNNLASSSVITVTVNNPISAPSTSSGLIVDFGATSDTTVFGAGWSTVIKDIYTDYQNIGPGGATIVFGDNYTYNYQGVTGSNHNFGAGDKIKVTWYNNSNNPINFVPKISLTDSGRPASSSGVWYDMSATTIPPLSTSFSEYAVSPATAGSYSLVNVNVNYANTRVVVADKIELVAVGGLGSDTAQPLVSITAPTNGTTVRNVIAISAAASDNVGVVGVQFKLDGVKLDLEQTVAPYSVSWNTATASNGAHSITAVARDAAGNQTTSVAIVVSVNNPQENGPMVAITAPSLGATVNGLVTITASASPSASTNSPVAGIQFKLDGVNLGPQVSSRPYSVLWNSVQTAAGSHVITAVARDRAGVVTTSAAVNVTVGKITTAAPPSRRSTDFSLTEGEAKAWTMADVSPAITVGYARVAAETEGSALEGSAIFSYRSNGVLVSQAAVPASPPVQSGRLYVEVNGPTNTGIAIANPNNDDVLISFSLTNASGSDLSHGTFTLGANRQLAAFLSEAPFNFPDKTEGALTFSSSRNISVVGLRGLTNERGDFLMTTLPVTSLEITDVEAQSVLPHFAIGDGWTTKLVLVNPTDSLLTGIAEVLSPGSENSPGAPLTVSINGSAVSSFGYSIPAHGISRLSLNKIGSGISVGSVRFTGINNRLPISGLAIFAYAADGVTVSEASVPIDRRASNLTMYVESAGQPGTLGSFQPGIALANPESFPVAATLELSQADGTPTAWVGSVTIPPGGQIARFLKELIPGVPDEFAGLLHVSAARPLGAIGLRLTVNERGDYLVTTSPVANEATKLANQEFFFPQMVMGGGFSTEIVVFNAKTGTSTSGNMTFSTKDGALLPAP